MTFTLSAVALVYGRLVYLGQRVESLSLARFRELTQALLEGIANRLHLVGVNNESIESVLLVHQLVDVDQAGGLGLGFEHFLGDKSLQVFVEVDIAKRSDDCSFDRRQCFPQQRLVRVEALQLGQTLVVAGERL